MEACWGKKGLHSYGCIHHPWLNEHGQALKDHGRAWIELKMTVILDAKMGTCVFDHTQRGE